MERQTYIVTLRVSLKGGSTSGAQQILRDKVEAALKGWNEAEVAATHSTWLIATQNIAATLEEIEASLKAIRTNANDEARLSQYWLNIQALDKKVSEGVILPLVDANREMIQQYLQMPPKRRPRFWPFGRDRY